MSGGLARLNALPEEAARAELLHCCGSTSWARRMAAARPFAGPETLAETAERVWWELGADDWLEAFAAHPRIGEQKAGEGQAAVWSAEEQAAARTAAGEALAALAAANREYEARFGHIFIVCATGKSAAEMLALLSQRLGNDPDTELRVAAGEQLEITQLRLERLSAA